MIQPLWRTVWRFLKKLKIELPYDPAIPLLGIYPEKTIIQKESCTTVFTAALFTIARTWKQPKCPWTDEWIKKMWHIYTMEYYSAIKRNFHISSLFEQLLGFSFGFGPASACRLPEGVCFPTQTGWG